MKGVTFAVVLAACCATPALAQEKASAMLPSGWHMHLDPGEGDPSQVMFMSMGPGFHATTGPAGVFWNPANTMHGPFTITATFTQTKAPMHPEAYGLFIGGKDLDSANASYGYLIVRGDGKYAIKHRANATEVHTVQDWTDLASMQKADAAGKATNTVSFQVGTDSVRAFVNKDQVKSWPLAYWTAEGIAGIRVNHMLDVHISNFAVTPGK